MHHFLPFAKTWQGSHGKTFFTGFLPGLVILASRYLKTPQQGEVWGYPPKVSMTFPLRVRKHPGFCCVSSRLPKRLRSYLQHIHSLPKYSAMWYWYNTDTSFVTIHIIYCKIHIRLRLLAYQIYLFIYFFQGVYFLCVSGIFWFHWDGEKNTDLQVMRATGGQSMGFEDESHWGRGGRSGRKGTSGGGCF